ncbi:MAG: MTH1187 family thiamine-binding protein [Myxococcota bacterium]
MKVSADVCVIPIGVGTSLSSYVGVVYEELERSGLRCRLHAWGTNVEGEYDEVFAALRRCLEQLHAKGVPRVSCTIKLGSRTDREQSLENKVASVEVWLRERRGGGTGDV